MGRNGIILLAGLAISTTGHGQQVVREWQGQVALDVDPAGQVTQAPLLNDVPEAIAKPAAAVMQQWRFKPVKEDGHTVAARTYAFVKLQVVQRDPSTFGLKVLYGSNGPRLRPTTSPLPFPATFLALAPGALLIEAVAEPDGQVDHVKVVESHFANKNRSIDSTARRAIGQWRADPELVDGHPIATRVQVSVVNCGTEKDCDVYKRQLKLLYRPSATGAPASGDVGPSVAVNSPIEPLSVAPGG